MKVHAYMRDKLLFGRPWNEGACLLARFMPERAIKAGATVEDLQLPVITIGSFGEEV